MFGHSAMVEFKSAQTTAVIFSCLLDVGGQTIYARLGKVGGDILGNLECEE